MDQLSLPTRQNLILAKNNLALSKQGYNLLDKKRQILLNELSAQKENLTNLLNIIPGTFARAYEALAQAKAFSAGKLFTQKPAVESTHRIHFSSRSVMGVELPMLKLESLPYYPGPEDLWHTTVSYDKARRAWMEALKVIVKMAELQTTATRLELALAKTQKRAAALEHILIPKYELQVKDISRQLEEQERDGYSRVKAVTSY